VKELRNLATRTVGFSPDGSFVILWSRVPQSAGGGLVNAVWAVPTMGGPLRPYLRGVAEPVSEVDFSPDGKRMVHHPPTEGDPLFVTDGDGKVGRPIFVGRPGFHNHFPLWSRDGAFIYFVHGQAFDAQSLDDSDIWRISATGGTPERLTFHSSRVTFPTLLDNRTLLYLATDEDGSGPWIYAVDVDRRVPHRVFSGIDQYRSLAASSDGRRVVATVSRSTARLWRVPIGDRVMEQADATPLPLPTTNSLSPRIGPGQIVYRVSKAGTESLWKVTDGGAAAELWDGNDGRPITGAAIAPDGRLAFVVQRRGRQLYVMNADGTGARRIASELDVRGAPAWSPDGKWLVVAANRDGEPKLFKIPVEGGPPVVLVNEYSTDPIWAPSGQFLVYSGADVGTNFAVKAVGADGLPRTFPNLILTRGARRMAFLGEDALIVMKGDVSHKEFWHLDLTTGRERQLTRLGRSFTIGDFDVSSDGRAIIFDRTREESDIVLFERSPR
jgi:Tol biopolymer transport system component